MVPRSSRTVARDGSGQASEKILAPKGILLGIECFMVYFVKL